MPFTKGHKSYLTEESKRKISETCKLKGVGKWMMGRMPTEETRAKLSKNNAKYWLGKKRPDLTGPKNSRWVEKYPEIKTYGRGRKRPDVSKRLQEENPNKGKFGREHSCWKEDKKAPLYKSVRQIHEYRVWRTAIFERDNYTCVMCGVRCVALQVDHHPKRFIDIVRENNLTTIDDTIACKEMWDLNNGRTLCIPCHKKTDTWGKQKS